MYPIGMTQWIVGNEPLELSCERLSRYGYDEIEFAAEPHFLDPNECIRLMEKYGLRCSSLCGIYNEQRDLTGNGDKGKEAIKYLTDCVDLAKKVGAKIIIVVPSPVGRTIKPVGMSMESVRLNAVKNIQIAADYAAESDIKFAVETLNRYETYFINTVSDALNFTCDVNRPNVGIMADLFHMNIEEKSIIESLYASKDKLLHVHIADNTREAAGMGHTDFKEILRALKDIHYNGSLTMEFMYKVSDPYSATNIKTNTELIDKYTKQAIEYIRCIENCLQS